MYAFNKEQVAKNNGIVFESITSAVSYLVSAVQPSHYCAPIHGFICAGYTDNGEQGEKEWREHYEIFRFGRNRAIIMIETTDGYNNTINVLDKKTSDDIYFALTAGE